MSHQHHYSLTVKWNGNSGQGTANYTSYERSHSIISEGKPEIPGSSDPVFRGDKSKYNPEEMLVASVSACHMLWYLHLCAESGVVVLGYVDHATGILVMENNGIGHFSEVTLHPVVIVAETEMIEKANMLHEKANRFCFIANSINFPVYHKPTCKNLARESSNELTI